MVTTMCYHFLAPEGGHPTWEEKFIENKTNMQGPFYLSVSASVYVRSMTNPGIYTPGERARI